MFATLEAKILAGALALLVLVGAALALYAGYEHMQAQKAQITQLQADNAREKANTAAALVAASAVAAALDTKATVAATATKNHTASTAQLASAVAANKAVASTVVPEDVWTAIYGSNANAK
jgi:hypothetical protein